MSCLVLTKEMGPLRAKFASDPVYGSEKAFLDVLSLWQEENGVTSAKVPSEAQLRGFIAELEAEDEREIFEGLFGMGTEYDELRSLPQVTRDFTPDVLARRVDLVARLFSQVLDDEMRKELKRYDALIDSEEDDERRNELVQERDRLDRHALIKHLTPKAIFMKVYRQFDPSRVSEEKELAKLHKAANAAQYGEDRLRAAARKRAEHKREEFEKIRRNFGVVSELATIRLKTTEQIVVSPTYLNAELDDGVGVESEGQDFEKSQKESWMSDVQHITGTESLSVQTRAALRNIKRQTKNRKDERDDLGFVIYEDVDNIVGTIFDALTDMIDSDDMIPLLSKAAAGKPWLRQVIKMCEEDDRLRTMLYRDFCKDFIRRTAQKTDRKTGKRVVVDLNEREGGMNIIKSVNSNYRAGNRLDEQYSITDGPGKSNKARARKAVERIAAMRKWMRENTDFGDHDGRPGLTSQYASGRISQAEYSRMLLDFFAANKDFTRTLASLLRGVGIEMGDNDVLDLLTVLSDDIGGRVSGRRAFRLTPAQFKAERSMRRRQRGLAYNPLELLLDNLSNIYSWTAGGELDAAGDEPGKTPGSAFRASYLSIASVVESVSGPSREMSVREMDATFSSRVQRSRLTRLIKQLRDAIPDKEISDADKAAGYVSYFDKFVHTEFGQDFFYKNGEWKCGWLRELVEHPEGRDRLAIKNVLHSDGRKYSEWTAAEYMSVMINEWAAVDRVYDDCRWFPVPVRSNMDYADFIRFKTLFKERLTDDEIASLVQYHPEYEGMTQDQIQYEEFYRALGEVVMQEVVRISDVTERARLLNLDRKNASAEDIEAAQKIKHIAGYDIVYGKDGKVRKAGGSEFRFLPMLNHVLVDTSDPSHVELEGETNDGVKGLRPFLEFVNEAASETGGGERLQTAIRSSLGLVVERMFSAALEEMDRMGLFETERGRNVWLQDIRNTRDTLRRQKTEAIRRIKARLGAAWNERMQKYQDSLEKGVRYDLEESAVSEIERAAGRDNADVAKLRERYVGEEMLRRFYCDTLYASMQIDQLTIGDPAFFSDVTQKQKRYKMMSAPGIVLDKRATWRGERVGTDHDVSITLSDKIAPAPSYNTVRSVLERAVKEGRMNKIEMEYILTPLRKINWTDGQGFRTLPSLRKLLIMEGDEIWNDKTERAYRNVIEGKWDFRDLSVFFTVRKPFIATYQTVASPDGGTVKVPTMVKTSEAILMSIYPMICEQLSGRGALSGLNEFMVENGIDTAYFESALKSGGTGIAEIGMMSGHDEVKDYLSEVTGIKWGRRDPNVLHEYDYDDFVEQQFVHEHTVDEVQKSGTQFKKLLMSDLPAGPDVFYQIPASSDGRPRPKMTRNQINNLYNQLLTENILEEFSKLKGEFSDIQHVAAVLQDCVRKSNYCSQELLKAVTLRKTADGSWQFNIPPFDPVTADTVQRIANAYVRKRLLNSERRGGTAVQVTSWGLSEDLHVVETKQGGVYAECLISSYSAHMFDDYKKKVTRNGRTFWEIDLSKVPDKLLNSIGYRIPTEGKHSMMALRIVGFLPAEMGSAIMLPAEMPHFADSDFDVDKIFLSFYETENVNLESDRTDRKGRRHGRYVQSVIEYDYSKSPNENGRRQRNNALQDIEWTILTSPNTAERITKKSGMRFVKDAAYICDILRNAPEDEIRKEVSAPQGTSLIAALESLPSERIKELRSALVRDFEPYSVVTQSLLQQLNMSGNDLIGAYAVNNTSAATMQQTSLSLVTHKKDRTPIWLNGNRSLLKDSYGMPTYTLHEMRNARGDYISDYMTGYCAASVDNGKELLLESLNQTIASVSISCLLTRLGYTPLEVGLLFNQPIVRDITERLKRPTYGLTVSDIIAEVYASWADRAFVNGHYDPDFASDRTLPDEMLAKGILNGVEMDRDGGVKLNDEEKKAWYMGQLQVASNFAQMARYTSDISKLTQNTRTDSTGQGSTAAEVIKRMLDRRNFYRNNKTLTGVWTKKGSIPAYGMVNEPGFGMEEGWENRLRDPQQNALGFIDTSYFAAVEGGQELLGGIMPYYRKEFLNTIAQIEEFGRAQSLDVATIDEILKDYVTYWMTALDAFSSARNVGEPENVSTVYRDTREQSSANLTRFAFVNGFPARLEQMKSKPEIRDNGFVRRLEIAPKNDKCPVPTVVFDYGNMTRDERAYYTREWERMVFSDDAEVRSFANDLFRYDFYRSGLAFSPYSFGYLAPVTLRQGFPGYSYQLNRLLERDTVLTMNQNGVDYDFILQFMLNHTQNNRLWQTVDFDRIAADELVDLRMVEHADGTTGLVCALGEVSTVTSDRKSTHRLSSAYDEIDIAPIGRPTGLNALLVKEYERVEDGTYIYNFMPQFKLKAGNSEFYYILDNSNGTVATYRRVERLGVEDGFKEYEYGAGVHEIGSVVDANLQEDGKVAYGSSRRGDGAVESRTTNVAGQEEFGFDEAWMPQGGESGIEDMMFSDEDLGDIDFGARTAQDGPTGGLGIGGGFDSWVKGCVAKPQMSAVEALNDVRVTDDSGTEVC